MPAARFVGADGTEVVLDVPVGETLRDAAVDNLVPGITGDCGGYAACGTCHVLVDEPFGALLPTPSEDEEIVVEGLLTSVTTGSRLACQITMADDLDGITVHVPESQG